MNWRIAKIEIAVQMFTAKVLIFRGFFKVLAIRFLGEKLNFESRGCDCFKLKTEALL